MKFKEIVARITGLSVPVFGVQWSPKEPEVAAARRVIGYLEDRRVLYNPSEMESPDHCVQSVLQIRSYLTQEIGSHSEGRPGRDAQGHARRVQEVPELRGPGRRRDHPPRPDVGPLE